MIHRIRWEILSRIVLVIARIGQLILDIFTMNKTRKIILEAVIKLIFAILVPFLLIWSVNTLFSTVIPFTFKTWLAGLILIQIFNFYVRNRDRGVPYHPDDYEDEEDIDDEEDDEEYSDDQGGRSREMLKVYHGRKGKKNKPSRNPK